MISEILRVISSSPTDTQPVFDAIVKSGVHLFGGMNVTLRLVKGDYIETVASTNARFMTSVATFPSRSAMKACLAREPSCAGRWCRSRTRRSGGVG